jgi:hypothetical protein
VGVLTNLVVYVWREAYNVAVISTTEKEFAEKLKAWAELEGYRVTVKNGDYGLDYQ